jgi:uncharacterized protein
MIKRLYMPVLRLLHRSYKRFISPIFGDVCRFYPSCSDYALEAFEQHGLFRGGFLALCRLIRCNPWCEGGDDPVPPRKKCH